MKKNNQNQTSVLSSTDFVEMLQELQTTSFNISKSRNKPILEQTKRNKIRQELLDGLASYLGEVLRDTGTGVYRVPSGVVVEVPNQALYDRGKVEFPEMTGMISMVLDLSMQNLEYDGFEEIEEE